ncbi:MarR family transcriptional regulator, partial [Lactobacillus sp. XV13L]|nr:MarR family transcriptional regulator [Lactobacillus sp. XV13L]
SYDTLFKTFGLSEARFVILMYLYHEPHHCLLPSEIAAKTNSTRATVSKLTAKMIDQGLVAKSASTKDKRASYVNLTARGMNVLQSFLPYNYQAVKEIMSPLSSKEEKELFNLLQKLTIGKDKLEQWEKKIG